MNPAWKPWLFATYISFATWFVLAVEFTKVDGKLQYNPTAVVMCIELTKLSVAIFLDRFLDGGTGENATWLDWGRYGAPAILYAIVNNLSVYSMYHLNPAVYGILQNLKLVWAVVFGRFLLAQSFSSIQWSAVIFFLLSMAVVKIEMLQTKEQLPCSSKVDNSTRNLLEHNYDETFLYEHAGATIDIAPFSNFDSETLWMGGMCGQSSAVSGSVSSFSDLLETASNTVHRVLKSSSASTSETSGGGTTTGAASAVFFFYGMIFVTAQTAFSGLAGAVNEKLLKDVDKSLGLWRKNAFMYEWGVVVNVGFLILREEAGSKGQESTSYLRGFSNPWVWNLVMIEAIVGLTTSLILKNFSNVIKNIGSLIVIFTVAFASMLVFQIPLAVEFWIGSALFVPSLFLYAGPHNDILKKHDLELVDSGRDEGEQQSETENITERRGVSVGVDEQNLKEVVAE